MGSTINLRKKRKKWTREIIVVILAIALTTVGIRASDMFFNGDEAVIGDSGACSSGMVLVSAAGGDFCIDKYEASASDDCPALNPGSQADTRVNLETSGCKPVSRAGANPWRNLSQNQAAEACAKAGKRLATNQEWLKAALGTPDPESDWQADDCNVAKNWEQSPGPAGSGANCLSASGAYDMIGNVWEWVEGSVFEGEFDDQPLPTPGYIQGVDENGMPTETSPEESDPNYYSDYAWIKSTGVRGIARGGYWDNQAEAGQYSLYIVTPPSYTGVGIGFRCVK